ncbi:hypothetical protein GC096_30410 [Paenibacillus sp. LMG 31461]|uniref:site-specific DNA-methyltransferase (adenine-specific) n=1 Tax=Paenibacillus plantarum TaxID=2654975 RepID=A0ABX1XIN7_9BACL|nr:hypothetical protein [Paenibacillus plantarum]NOU68343.1 hypothetical protein [Paenibacillus plantarum]
MDQYQQNVQVLLNKLDCAHQYVEEELLKEVASFLGYELRKNPINPESNWRMLGHSDFEGSHVIAIRYIETLTAESTVNDLRKLFEDVETYSKEYGASEAVTLLGFVGRKRIVWFRAMGGNRDERLDISEMSIQRVSLYAELFINTLSYGKAKIEPDEFGFGFRMTGIERLFTRELGSRFHYIVGLYRRRMAEIIVRDKMLRSYLLPLLTEEAKSLLKRSDLHGLVETVSFKAAVGAVVDTLVLRIILRHFLEAYHGPVVFTSKVNFEKIGLGFAEGRMEDVLDKLVTIEFPDVKEELLKEAVQITLFDDFYEELTPKVQKRPGLEEEVRSFQNHLREQFELAYGGDLFAGDVAEVATTIEKALISDGSIDLLKLIADTSSDRYNFRYQDLPPEMIQNHYEISMSSAIQIDYTSDDFKIHYGSDKQEQKQKGAYYTDNRLVEYMVRQALGNVFQQRLLKLQKFVSESNIDQAIKAIEEITDIKIIDITCGGGSFLRGAFRYLSAHRKSVAKTIEQVPELVKLFPYFTHAEEAQSLWERHILLNNIYGIDIDYKALIISSQTLTLATLENWQPGVNFPRMIGLTLAHQNALISPFSHGKGKSTFRKYKTKIARLIELRTKIKKGDPTDTNWREMADIRLNIRNELIRELSYVNGFTETLRIDILELHFPEVFFNPDGGWSDNAGFDVGLGNPPWEAWKVNPDEFFESYYEGFSAISDNNIKKEIENEIFIKYPRLKQAWETQIRMYESANEYFRQENMYNFLRWRVSGRFTGSDLNLYKLSIERFWQLIKAGGIVSVLVPGNIGTDLGSSGLRHLLFDKTNLIEMLGFENKNKRIFENVHGSYKFTVVTFQCAEASTVSEFKAFFYRNTLDDLSADSLKIDYPVDYVRELAPESLVLMEYRSKEELSISRRLMKFPTVKECLQLEYGFEFKSGLHMTSKRQLFNTDGVGIPLVEGKHISQFGMAEDFKESIRYWIDTSIHSQAGINGKGIIRLLLREVARGTDRRTTIATIVPKQTAIANTLWVLDTSSNYKKMLYLCGILNSYTVDFFSRRKVDKHLSKFILESLPLVLLEENDLRFQAIVERVAKLVCTSNDMAALADELNMPIKQLDLNEVQTLRAEIDAIIASLYGLKREEIIMAISTFESPMHVSAVRKDLQKILEYYDVITSKEEEHSCP